MNIKKLFLVSITSLSCACLIASEENSESSLEIKTTVELSKKPKEPLKNVEKPAIDLEHTQEKAVSLPVAVEKEPSKKVDSSPQLAKEEEPATRVNSTIPRPETMKAASQNGNSSHSSSFLTIDYAPPGLASIKSLFFQSNIGVGFLYFNKVRGNLMGRPTTIFSGGTNNDWRDSPIRGPLKYNRTPLYEYILGYRMNNYLSVSLSYQYQGWVTVQTNWIHTSTPGSQGVPKASDYTKLSSSVSLNGFFLKFYLEMPLTLNFKKMAISSYLGAGVGPGWQSWTYIEDNFYRGSSFILGQPIPLRQKLCGNAVWMLDTGLQIQESKQDPSYTLFVGCKYNQWGQARNIGLMSQQGAQKLALTQPFRIKTVYQFAPYIGFQWNFANANLSNNAYCLNGKQTNVWRPYFANLVSSQPSKTLWTQFNVGYGLLYFSGVKGNIMGQPVLNFAPASQFRDVPLKGRLEYNKTPLFEFLLGYQLNSWAKLAFSYQYQAGVTARTQSLYGFAVQYRGSSAYFQSSVALNAMMLKFYMELPYGLVMKNIATTPYLAVGIGPGWQTWTNNFANYISARGASGQVGLNASGGPLQVAQKISANLVWMLDVGFKMRGVYPNSQFSTFLGCKYNQWGQARSMGKMSQQMNNKRAFTDPVRIKMVYQFAPYMGVQWNFMNPTPNKASYCLDGKNPNRWKPFVTNMKNFQCPNGILTQFNVGVGFLYFSGYRGNLMGQPTVTFNSVNERTSALLRGKLSYNKTPLFEYLIGYKFTNWCKAYLSYQHQAGLFIASEAVDASSPPGGAGSSVARFLSQLELDGLMAKTYFEFPLACVVKSIAITPYLAVGIGAGWQTWSRPRGDYTHQTTQLNDHVVPFQGKVCASAIWMLDCGFRMQSAYPQSGFSVLLGCKYNQWGQARNIGIFRQTQTLKLGLWDPVRIKMVYQFAPYLGVQWNF